jgi:hypothetical protein
MTKQRLLGPTLFATLIFAAAAAGCSGGAKGTLPPAPGNPAATNENAARKHRTGATLRIQIPPAPRRHRHGANYVSPSTQSMTVLVQEVTASPWPSIPLQTLVVATPKPCVEATGGVRTCTFAVKAFVGKNVFTFNQYASKNPSPQDTPLATLTSGVTKVTNGTPQLDFTMQGVVASVLVDVPDPESTHDPAAANTEAIPIGSPTSFPLMLAAHDSAGNIIAADTFSSPITVTVSPANSGVKLALVKQCTGDTATPTSVTMQCADDLTQLSIAYDGTVTQTGSNSYVDTATVVASPQLASPSPHPAIVALSSNVIAYELVPAPFPSPQPSVSNVSLDPVSGKLVFAYTFSGVNPTFVEFDPANPAAAPATHSIGFGVGFLIFDATGHLWTNDQTSPALHCFTSISATGATVDVSDVNGAVNNAIIAPDASGNIWYSGLDVSLYPSAGFFPGSCTAGSQSAQFLINAADEAPYGLALAQPSGGNAAIGMVTSGNNFFTMNTATAASPTPAAVWPVGEYPQGLVNDKAYNIYGASSGTPVVNKIAAGTANIQTLVNLPPGSYPYGIDQFSGTQSTAQALALFDDAYDAGVFINPAATSTEPLEMPMQGYTCDAIGFDKNGSAWMICQNDDGSIWAKRMVVTSTWNPLFGSYVVCSPFTAILDVPESSSVSQAPFTITANTNPAVIATATPFPGNYPHEIPVVINSAGTTTLTIADKNGRTAQITTTVANYSCSRPRPHHRRHP